MREDDVSSGFWLVSLSCYIERVPIPIKRSGQSDLKEPMKTPSLKASKLIEARENVRVQVAIGFGFYIWLVEEVARLIGTNHRAQWRKTIEFPGAFETENFKQLENLNPFILTINK